MIHIEGPGSTVLLEELLDDVAELPSSAGVWVSAVAELLGSACCVGGALQ